MSFIFKSIGHRQFLLSKSFTYFWAIYHIVKLQNCSSLDDRVIASKMSKSLLSLIVLQIVLQFLLNMSFTYSGLIYMVKLQNCSALDGRVIATKMSKCLLSLKVLQSNINVLLAWQSRCKAVNCPLLPWT